MENELQLADERANAPASDGQAAWITKSPTETRTDRSLTDKPTELTMRRYRLNACAILVGCSILALIKLADYFGFAR